MEATGVYWKPVWHVLEDEFAVDEPMHVRVVMPRGQTDSRADCSFCRWRQNQRVARILSGSRIGVSQVALTLAPCNQHPFRRHFERLDTHSILFCQLFRPEYIRITETSETINSDSHNGVRPAIVWRSKPADPRVTGRSLRRAWNIYQTIFPSKAPTGRRPSENAMNSS